MEERKGKQRELIHLYSASYNTRHTVKGDREQETPIHLRGNEGWL